MGASPALGDHVVDVLGRTAAVLALEVVPDEDGPAGQRGPGPVRHLHEVIEPDDARSLHRDVLGMEGVAVRVDDLGLAFQREDQGSAYTNHAERLIGSVQDKSSPQGALSI
jgi:hypothetical protein